MAEAIGERDSLDLLPISVWSPWVRSSRHSIPPESQSSINFNMAERWAAVGSENYSVLGAAIAHPSSSHTHSLSAWQSFASRETGSSRIGAAAVAPGEKASGLPAVAHTRLGDTLC